MTTVTKIVLLGIALSVLAIGLSFFTNPSVKAQGPPVVANVKVVNTTSNPVPTAAQGITDVSGTVGLASGTSVSVSNSLNSSGNPVPVLTREVDNSGLNPFAVTGNCSTPGNTGCIVNIVFPSTIANGGAAQTAVVDFVSSFCEGIAGGTGQDNFNVFFSLRGQPYEVFLPATVDQFGTARITLQTALYVDPGSTAKFGTPGNEKDCFVTMTGHLIPQ